MSEEHYSLRWNNHQNHMLTFMEELLKKEEYCDVSLVSDERWTIRAHKVVLSACSPFFSKIFSENPCKHPVIVLKDFSRADVQRIIDFMYKGEISVGKEQLQSLLKVAEDLQVRGLSNYEGTSPSDKASICANRATPTPSPSPNDFERNFYSPGRFPMPATAPRTPMERISPYSPTLSLPPMFDPSMKMPHLPKLNFPDHHHHPFLTHHQECQPRRKQMRPRRRSGDLCTPQDLSTHQQQNNNHNNNNNNNNNNNHNSNNNNNNNVASLGPAPVKPASTPPEETAQNLCTKRKRPDKDGAEVGGGPVSLKQENVALMESGMMPDPSGSPEMDLSMSSSNKEYISRASPPAVHGLPPTLNMKQEVDSHSPVHFPPSVNALAMTPPHAKYFGLDTPLLFSPAGLDGCRSALFDMPDARSTPDPQLFMKKKMGRPKGQHSAPRGGPPRSWTNAELTEALQNVWNKKMTTSQASRIFGIPYNSLLMYVRGKYGKSLKLEQLRKDCIGGPAAPMDLLPNININNNNKTDRDNNEQIQPNTRPPSTEDPPPHPQPFLNALPFAAHGFFPDFAPNFPMPVSMVHLMAPSERNRDGYGPPPHHDDERDRESDRAEKENEDEPSMFRPPVLSVDDTRKLVQQNGQD